MDNYNLLTEGLNLMMLGMGFVFVFLTVLVIATSLMSWVIGKYEKSVGMLPEEGIPAPTAVISHSRSTRQPGGQAKDQHIIPVLSAAIHKYRSRHRK